jgi:hypothetical protein
MLNKQAHYTLALKLCTTEWNVCVFLIFIYWYLYTFTLINLATILLRT